MLITQNSIPVEHSLADVAFILMAVMNSFPMSDLSQVNPFPEFCHVTTPGKQALTLYPM